MNQKIKYPLKISILLFTWACNISFCTGQSQIKNIKLLIEPYQCELKDKEKLSKIILGFENLKNDKSILIFDQLKSKFNVFLNNTLSESEKLVYYLFNGNTLQRSTYSKNDQNTKTKYIFLASRSMSNTIWSTSELAEFWKDTIVVLDTLSLDCSKIGGIYNSETNYVIDNKVQPFEELKKEDNFIIHSNSANIIQGQYTSVKLNNKQLPEIKYLAKLYYLTENDKINLLSYIDQLLKSFTNIDEIQLRSYVITYLDINFGKVDEKSLSSFLINHSFIK